MLHIVRRIPPRFDGNKLGPEEFAERISEIGRVPGALFGTWTTRRPRRTAELASGSVYFVSGRETIFRAELVRVERIRDFSPSVDVDARFADGWSLTCRCELIPVETLVVHRLRGWRYLSEDDAPADAVGTGRRSGESEEPSR